MKTCIVALLAVALHGCGEPVSPQTSAVRAPEIAPSTVKRDKAYVSGATQASPAEERFQRTAPDFKDSASSLDRSK